MPLLHYMIISFVSQAGRSGGRCRSYGGDQISISNQIISAKTYLGVEFGAQTTANDSGNIC